MFRSGTSLLRINEDPEVSILSVKQPQLVDEVGALAQRISDAPRCSTEWLLEDMSVSRGSLF